MSFQEKRREDNSRQGGVGEYSNPVLSVKPRFDRLRPVGHVLFYYFHRKGIAVHPASYKWQERRQGGRLRLIPLYSVAPYRSSRRFGEYFYFFVPGWLYHSVVLRR